MATAEAELKRLMLAGLDGDAAAHRNLLHQLGGHLRAYYRRRLERIGQGTTAAEDLVQEALLAIHIQRHTYDPSEPFTPWVYAIARYKLIDYLRATRSRLADVRMLGIAVLIGAVAAFAVMLLALGVRNDLPNPNAATYLPLKILFTLGTLVLTSFALTKLARPGGEQRISVAFVALPFIVIMLL